MKKIIFLFLILFVSIISVNAEGRSITIRRFDENNNQMSGELLKNTVVELYRRSGRIKTLTYDENGEIFIDNLELDQYTVKEYIAPLGYEVDKTEYNLYLEQDRNYNVNLKSKKIEGTLIINKYYKSDNKDILDNDAVFEVYKDNELVNTLSGIINEKLGYGNYVIKQVSGKKYYNFVDDFNVSITKTQNYKYDLYSDMEVELKEILDENEMIIKNKEEELSDLQNSLINERENLIKLKNELELKENNLNKEREELEIEKIKLEKLKEEINNTYIELNNKKSEIIEVEDKIKKCKDELNLLSDNINIKKYDLDKIKLELNNKEQELIDLREELNLLNVKIKEKENNLIDLESKLNNKEMELIKKEEDVLNIKNEIKKDILVVEVPNTYKRNYNKLLSKILIIIGSIFIIFSKRKVTIH